MLIPNLLTVKQFSQPPQLFLKVGYVNKFSIATLMGWKRQVLLCVLVVEFCSMKKNSLTGPLNLKSPSEVDFSYLYVHV